MKRLSLSRVLAGVVCVLGLAAIPGVGCGGGVGGEYSSLCHAQCTAWDDCENYTKIVVDINDCLAFCDTNADNAQASTEAQCSNYEIATAKVDGCTTSLSKVDQACLAKNQGDYNTYRDYALQDCGLQLKNNIAQLDPDYFVSRYVRCP